MTRGMLTGRRFRGAAVMAVAVAAAGCAGAAGPDYERPALDLPAAMPGARQPSVAAPRADWWRSFGDSELDALVAAARAGNLDLVAAEARLRAARAVARRAGAGDEMQLDAGLGWSRSRSSENSVSGVARRFADVADPDDLFTASADASWEPDLFGRIRRGVEAAEADADAVEDDRRGLDLALVADVADAWFDVGEADAETAIARETVRLLEETRKVVQARVDSGLVSELDLRRTDADLAAALARLPEPERRRAVAENRLALLLGRPPGLRAAGRAPVSFDVPAVVPVGVPAQLLERRPDLRAAERRLVAANARVGEAVADFYPRVRIVGRIGVEGLAADDLWKWGSRIWSIGPSVTLPILDGGEREFRAIEAEARRDAAAAEWTSAVLRALQEVGDAMVSLDARRRTREATRSTVVANEKTVELALVRFREGLTSHLEALDAQRALAAARLEELRAQRAVLAELVRLHRALGGGWEVPVAPPPGR